MRIQPSIRIAALVAVGALTAAQAHAGATPIDPARRLALFIGNAETANSLHELANVMVQSFGYSQPVELYGPAATQDAVRQSLARIVEDASRFDSVTVVIGLSSVRLSRDDPFGQFLVPAGGSAEQRWTLLPVGEVEKFLMGTGRAAASLLVLPQCPSTTGSTSSSCPYASGDRSMTTVSVCTGARGEDHLMSRFLLDGSRILSAFAVEAGTSVRAATVRELMAASKEGYQAVLRQCPPWADPFTFVVAQSRLAAALTALDRGGLADERVKAVERLVRAVSTEPADHAASSVAAAIDRLATLLFDTSEPVALRSRAAWGLAQLNYPPQPVVDRMVDLIATDTETPFVRVSTIDALAGLGDPAAAAALRASLGRSGVTAVAPEIIAAIGRRRDPASLPLLVNLASQADDRLRRAAFGALTAFGGEALRPHSAALNAALLASMRTPASEVRRAGLAFAGSTGSFGTISAILGVMASDPDPRVREAAAYAVGRSLERKEVPETQRQIAVARLLEASARGPNEVRAAALWSLGHAGGSRSEDRLIDVLRSAQEPVSVRSAAAEALGLGRSARGVPGLAETLQRPEDVKLRTVAADSLGAIGTPAAAEALLRVVADDKVPADVRSAARAAMERVKPASASIERLDDKSAAVRMETVRLIGEARDAQYAPKLIEKLADPDAEVRVAAHSALALLADDASAVQALIGTLENDPDVLRRVGVARVLGASTTLSARVSLINAIERDKTPAVRAIAVEALGRQAARSGASLATADQVARALRSTVGDANSTVRRSAARALGALGDPESDELLKKMTLDPSPEVREAAFESLAQRTRTKK